MGKFLISLAFAAAIAPFLFLTITMRRDNLSGAYPAAAAAVFAFTYIALPLGMLVQLRQQWAGGFLLLYLLLVVWAYATAQVKKAVTRIVSRIVFFIVTSAAFRMPGGVWW